MKPALPGTEQHQQILETIINSYADDRRVLAILLFGSLGRGNWDAHSDLDLDIVIHNNIPFDVTHELEHLCESIKNQHGFDSIIIADKDEGDVVLSNLVEFSIRYHTVAGTKPAILDSMVSITGSLAKEQIRAAGEANRSLDQQNLSNVVNEIIRNAVGMYKAISRQRIWMSLELSHRIRSLIMQIYSIAHCGDRPLQYFEQSATPQLHERLKKITPQPDITSLGNILEDTIDLMDHDLDAFSGGMVQINAHQQAILFGLKQQINRTILAN